MESNTISTRTLTIEGMSSDACVQKVTEALKGAHGVSTQSVTVGSATIGADRAGFTSACAAVAGAGYKVLDGARRGEANGATQKPSSGDTNADQPRSPGRTDADTPNPASPAVESANTKATPKAGATRI